MKTSNTSNTQDYQEAFYGIAYSALISIGDYVDEDLSRFNVAINRMTLFNGFTNAMADAYHERIQPFIDRDWEKYLEAAAAILPYELKETAFAISCDLVMPHGFVPPKASGYLEMLQKVLGIESVLAGQITTSIKIKNRG